MERIWAPWRRAYITAASPAGCFLCEAGEAEAGHGSLVLARTRHSLIMLNRYPYVCGHLMVAPLRHTAELDTMDDAELLDLMQGVRRCRTALQQTMQPDAFNIGMNLGHPAGAGVADHLHIHVVPRWQGDTNFMPIVAGVSIVSEGLPETFDRLLPAFNDY